MIFQMPLSWRTTWQKRVCLSDKHTKLSVNWSILGWKIIYHYKKWSWDNYRSFLQKYKRMSILSWIQKMQWPGVFLLDQLDLNKSNIKLTKLSNIYSENKDRKSTHLNSSHSSS